ncbi:hypothetical protein FRB96_009348 [Tulasnella sp. 330]|nr:hypothetical protein FRB96_009348 [Tulasnella sp. 330]KAG8884424.1 hypothetical protein FRB98_002396 [Tulasnella sp. 332]KAG8885260.1 hypothetical protein FRB97_001706 [Tulasnella sp. 331]
MFATRRPAPINVISSAILSYTSSSSLSSDLDYDCETPGLLTQSSTQTASENDSPPITPIRPITNLSPTSKHAELVDRRKQSILKDDQQVLHVTPTLPQSSSIDAPRIVYTQSYWRQIDGGSQEDLGYEAEAEGHAASSAGSGGSFGTGHRRVASRPRQQRTASPIRAKDVTAIHVLKDIFSSSSTDESPTLVTETSMLATPINSPTLTPTATPKLSSSAPRFSLGARSSHTTTLSGLGLGLPPCLSKSDVEPGSSRLIPTRIQSAPAPGCTPSTPTITSTLGFASPLHKHPTHTPEVISPILLSTPPLPLHFTPPPPMYLLPIVIDQLPSPLELPGSQMSGSAETNRKIGSPISLRRPAYITRRSTSLSLLLDKKDVDLNDPSSPFYSPVPPSLVGSPRLKGRGGTPSGSPIRHTSSRRVSVSVSQYASQIRDRPGVPSGRPWHPAPAINTPPVGFVTLPLSPEFQSVDKMSEWKATQDRFREVQPPVEAGRSLVEKDMGGAGVGRLSETVNPYFA